MSTKVITLQYKVKTDLPEDRIIFHVSKGGIYLGDVYEDDDNYMALVDLHFQMYHPLITVLEID